MNINRISLVATLCLVLSSCASFLPGQVRENIHPGMSAEEVRSELGEPDGFSSTFYTYYSKYDACVIAFQFGKVIDASCGHDQEAQRQDRREAFRGLAQSFQQPVQAAPATTMPLSCTTTRVGNSASTQCY